MSEGDVVDAVMRRQRAHRTFTDDPVDDATVTELLELATRAPSAQNAQPWEFVVVRDPARRAALWELGARVWAMGGSEAARAAVPAEMHADVDHGITAGFAAAPVSIVIGVDTTKVAPGTGGSSIWPAVQNLLLAATARGLGSALTTIATIQHAELRALVGLPDHIDPVAVVPLGHPARRLGSSRREPVVDHAHREEYGTPW